MPTEPKRGLAARTRVLDARNAGRDWMLVADCNDIPATTARDIVNRGTPEVKQRGGSRAACVNTPEMEAALVEYIEENCLYTLAQMQEMLHFDFGVRISTSLISKKLCDKMYTMKQVRVELETCNSAQNIKKRKDFADSLLAHEINGSFIVYYGETNYNIYCKRSQGRALIGERAVVKLPPSKGANLQLQCAISPEVGLVQWSKQRGNIKMEMNAAFVDDVYDAVKATDVYRDFFVGKTIVIILDNAPAHSQAEDLIKNRGDLELLRLGPYSPMCNPIEGCFSVLKARIKAFLVFNVDQMFDLPYGEKTERRMRLLENAADHGIECMDLRLVNRMARHSAHAVAAAARNEPMQYGL